MQKIYINGVKATIQDYNTLILFYLTKRIVLKRFVQGDTTHYITN